NDGYLVKKKSRFDGSRLKTDPRYERVRENMAEFGTAAKASKLVRNSIMSLLQIAKDDKTTSRLVKVLQAVQKTDATSVRGKRHVNKGNIQLLSDFNFNKNAALTSVFHGVLTSAIDRITGAMAVVSSAFVPTNLITSPLGATHYKMVCAGVELDFDNNIFLADNTETAYLPIDNISTSFNLQVNAPANSTHKLMLVLGIKFFELVNGVQYPLSDNSANALTVIKVS
ncbi:MAG TPA: hypothetical protein VGO09_09410, partial [Flavisolibacter sp.]|nr:hypothetical protein [Flavisolibacter sp.]